jgi:hypothetical protein
MNEFVSVDALAIGVNTVDVLVRLPTIIRQAKSGGSRRGRNKEAGAATAAGAFSQRSDGRPGLTLV